MMALVQELGAFIGEWTMGVTIPEAPQGRVLFEWMPGERFLIERWDIPHPDAPDGVAIMGYDEGRGTLLQHYFDSRGVARVYDMGLEEGVSSSSCILMAASCSCRSSRRRPCAAWSPAGGRARPSRR